VVTLLRVVSVGLRYESGPCALAGVSIEVARGELVCVLGPNGSGKSTLLHVAGGRLVPTEGRVEVEGRPLASLRPRERARRIAPVPQILTTIPETDVASFVLGGRYAYLDLWGRVREGDRAAVRRALEAADAIEWADRRLSQLSGGQLQRVLVARALAQEAPLLLFDEPTAALDPEHQVLVFELIRRLAREGRGALVATHELSLASCFADRVVLLDAGRVVAEGAPGDVLRAEVLTPVYGRCLVFGGAESDAGERRRPWIVTWPHPGSPGPPGPPRTD